MPGPNAPVASRDKLLQYDGQPSGAAWAYLSIMAVLTVHFCRYLYMVGSNTVASTIYTWRNHPGRGWHEADGVCLRMVYRFPSRARASDWRGDVPPIPDGGSRCIRRGAPRRRREVVRVRLRCRGCARARERPSTCFPAEVMDEPRGEEVDARWKRRTGPSARVRPTAGGLGHRQTYYMKMGNAHSAM